MLVFNKSRFPLTIEGVTIPALESKEIKITASNQGMIDRLVNQNQITLLGGVDLNKGTSQSESASISKVLKFPEAPKKRRKRSKRKNLNS